MTQDHIRALDQLRQRLSQLSSSIASLRADLERNEPLPTWPSLQNSAQALSFNLQQLGQTMQTHRQFFKDAHAYPIPTFPGATQEAVLAQLLRKKLVPDAEDWVDEYTTRYAQKGMNLTNGTGDTHTDLSPAQMRELWEWAGPTSTGIVGPMLEDGGAFDEDFTIAEREDGVDSVVTGLKRKLDGEEDEDEDEVDGDTMEDVLPHGADGLAKEVDPGVPPMSTDSVVRFMTTGKMPNSTTLPNR